MLCYEQFHYKVQNKEMKKRVVKKTKYHINQYEYMNKIGAGGYCQVFEGINNLTHEKFAIKKIAMEMFAPQDLQSKDEVAKKQIYRLKSLIIREAFCMYKLQTPFTIQLKQVIFTQKNAYIVSELCDQTLEGYIQQSKKVFDQKKSKMPMTELSQQNQKQSLNLVTQLLSGIYSLIVKNIYHKDLKPSNIMLKNGCIKIGDFGQSIKKCGYYDKNKFSGKFGTPFYRAPQLLEKSQHYTSKSEVYSFGCIFYEILYKKRLMKEVVEEQIKKQMMYIDKKVDFPRQPIVSEQCKQLITRCLKYNQSQRAGWLQIFNNKLFFGKVPNLENLYLSTDYIYSAIQKQADSRNMTLEQLLSSIKMSEKCELSLKQYFMFILALRTLPKSITVQQVNFSFNCLIRNQQNRVSVKELINCIRERRKQKEWLQKVEKFGYELVYGIFQKVNSDAEVQEENEQYYCKPCSSKSAIQDSKHPQKIQNSKHSQKNEPIVNKFMDQIIKKNVSRVLAEQQNKQDPSGITYEDFKKFIQESLNLSMTQTELKIAFDRYDSDHDKLISQKQFQKHIFEQLRYYQEHVREVRGLQLKKLGTISTNNTENNLEWSPLIGKAFINNMNTNANSSTNICIKEYENQNGIFHSQEIIIEKEKEEEICDGWGKNQKLDKMGISLSLESKVQPPQPDILDFVE